MTHSDRLGTFICIVFSIIFNNAHIQFVFMLCGKWCNPKYSGNKKTKLYKEKWSPVQRLFLIPLIGKKTSLIFKIYFILFYLNVVFIPVPLVVRDQHSMILLFPLINTIVLGSIALEIPHRL